MSKFVCCRTFTLFIPVMPSRPCTSTSLSNLEFGSLKRVCFLNRQYCFMKEKHAEPQLEYPGSNSLWTNCCYSHTLAITLSEAVVVRDVSDKVAHCADSLGAMEHHSSNCQLDAHLFPEHSTLFAQWEFSRTVGYLISVSALVFFCCCCFCFFFSQKKVEFVTLPSALVWWCHKQTE